MIRYHNGKQILLKLIEKPGRSPMGTSLYFVVGTGKLRIFTKQVLPVRRCTRAPIKKKKKIL